MFFCALTRRHRTQMETTNLKKSTSFSSEGVKTSNNLSFRVGRGKSDNISASTKDVTASGAIGYLKSAFERDGLRSCYPLKSISFP